MEQETIIYKAGLGGLAGAQFSRDKKKREKEGWKVQNYATTGRDGFGREIITATYSAETPASSPASGPQLNIPKLQPLLMVLSPEERKELEGQIHKIVDEWWLKKG